MLMPNKMNATIFVYMVVSFIAVSLVSFSAEKFEPYLIAQFVAEISPDATQQEAISAILKVPEQEVRGKLEMVVAVIAIIKLSVNAFILYLCSCCIARRIGNPPIFHRSQK